MIFFPMNSVRVAIHVRTGCARGLAMGTISVGWSMYSVLVGMSCAHILYTKPHPASREGFRK